MKITPFKRRLDVHYRAMVQKRPINVLASVLTITSLYLGTVSIFASIGQDFSKAAYCILAAIIFDGLDGTVARLTKSTSEFGKELDSLCDLVSFGVAPAVLVFMAYLPEGWTLPLSAKTGLLVSETGSYMAIVFVICAALRLARFNTYQAEEHDFFTGLPSPAAGGTLAAFVLFLEYYEAGLKGQPLGSFAHIALGPTAVFLALLMVSSVRYPKEQLKSFVLSPQHAFPVLGICAFSFILFHWALSRHASIVLFPLATTYVLGGIGYTLYQNFRSTGSLLPKSLSLQEDSGSGGEEEEEEEEEEPVKMDDCL
jgi:CDP-diacylglycerol---serine O-phosphatidyltransferase